MSRRTFEMFLNIDAPIDAVWRALTEADEITRWFSTSATVEPRPGGTYDISWGGEWNWPMEIADWQPPTRLRLIDRSARPFDVDGQPLADAKPVELVLEFTLESQGNRTSLRLVHSGFGTGANWDEEIDGISHGWPVELRILRHYLEHHAGKARQHVWVRATAKTTASRLWEALISPDGVVVDGSVAYLHGGDRARFRLATGDTIDGRVIAAFPPYHLAIAVDNMGGAVLDLQAFEAGGRAIAGIVLSSWSATTADIESFERRAQAALGRTIARLEATVPT